MKLQEVKTIAEFVALFYAKSFLQSALGPEAPFNDLNLIKAMREYAKLQPEVGATCLRSCNRHLWYLTPQLVVFALVDHAVPEDNKRKMATRPHNPVRKEISCGRPKFLSIDDNNDIELEDLISSESWLLFDLLGLNDHQQWLLTPPSTWYDVEEYQILNKFISSVSVTNDLAERGVKLISDFIDKCADEEQRDALTQIVEEHRRMYPNYNKETLCLV